jgi:hypothetical protein
VFIGEDPGMQGKFRTHANMAKLIGVQYPDKFYELFGWQNLYLEWRREGTSPAEDRERAEILQRRFREDGQRIVLVGDKVAEAFGVEDRKRNLFFLLPQKPSVEVARMIHPSQTHINIRTRQPAFEEAKVFAQSLLEYVHRQ